MLINYSNNFSKTMKYIIMFIYIKKILMSRLMNRLCEMEASCWRLGLADTRGVTLFCGFLLCLLVCVVRPSLPNLSLTLTLFKIYISLKKRIIPHFEANPISLVFSSCVSHVPNRCKHCFIF